MAFQTHAQALTTAGDHYRALAIFDMAVRSTVHAFRAIPDGDPAVLLSELEKHVETLDAMKAKASEVED